MSTGNMQFFRRGIGLKITVLLVMAVLPLIIISVAAPLFIAPQITSNAERAIAETGVSEAEIERIMQEYFTGRILNSFFLIGIFTVVLVVVVGYLLFKPVKGNYGQLSQHISNNLVKGDFGQELPAQCLSQKDELGELAYGLQEMTDNIKNILGSVRAGLHKVTATGESLAASAEEMNASLEEVASSANEFTGNAQDMSRSANDMQETGQDISIKTQDINQAVNEAVQQMQEISDIVGGLKEATVSLGERAQGITTIVDTINGIAEQTNLLALNAAIEAARAGDQGKGFAVVAEEVRKLAEQSAKSTTEISDVIIDIQEQINNSVKNMDDGNIKVQKGTEVVTEMGDVLGQLIASLEGITGQIEKVSAFAQEIGAGSEEVSSSVEEQTATMNEISNAAIDLQQLVIDLDDELKRFKI